MLDDFLLRHPRYEIDDDIGQRLAGQTRVLSIAETAWLRVCVRSVCVEA